MEGTGTVREEWREISFREALTFYAISDKTLRKRLTEGTLRGRRRRVNGREEWFVLVPPGAPGTVREPSGEALETIREPSPEPAETLPVRYAEPPGIPVEVAREWFDKIEGASYRVGYLEAQMAQMPALTEGAAAAGAREQEAARQAQEAAERARLAEVAVGQARRRERWLATVAGFLALLVAVLSACLLSYRRGEPSPDERSAWPSEWSSQSLGIDHPRRQPHDSPPSPSRRSVSPPRPIGASGNPAGVSGK